MQEHGAGLKGFAEMAPVVRAALAQTNEHVMKLGGVMQTVLQKQQ